MPTQLWAQDNFSKGELSPYMYGRSAVQQYYNGLKTAQNVLTYPTGAAGKRFGTLFQAILTGLSASNQLYFQTFQYLDVAIYQLIFTPLNIAVYLEGILLLNVTTTLDAENVFNLTSTTIGGSFRVSGRGFKPYDLTPGLNSPITITGATSNTFTVGAGLLAPNVVSPTFFATTGALPTTTPQIKAGIVYFLKTNSAGDAATVYESSYNAKFDIDPFVLTNAGTGTNTLVQLNNWTWAHTRFQNLPIYDFNSSSTSYDAKTFTPSATIGSGVVITVSGGGYAPLNTTYVGGAFIGAGGTSRITAVASVTSFTVSVQTPFDSTDPILGSLALLAEPAWSDARGWPKICSSYQNRALFANTESLPNGFYASVINDYADFGNLTTDDDDAISWYPSSNEVNVIRFIVPFRSITVHTNSGIYSSPLSEIAAITPSTFTLQLQDSTPADVLIPQAIDNQIIVISGNDVHTMLWDGINNAYTSTIVSIVSEQVIRQPVDEEAFADLSRAGSRYVFIVNSNGTLAVYQTLQSENVSGFTPQIMEQSYGSAAFLQVASSSNGRCWFVCQRERSFAGSPVAITAFTVDTLTAVGIGFTDDPTAVIFTTSGSLPVSSPQLELNTYYWARGVTTDTFYVYISQEDFSDDVNRIAFTSSGTSSSITAWSLQDVFTLEELTQDTYLDCAVYYNGTPSSLITTGTLFNAQSVKMVGDGFGFDAIGIGNQVAFESHGSAVEVSEAYIGFPINMVIEPMPISIPAGPTSGLTQPKHIRYVRFMFNNTIGGTINGVPIALVPFDSSGIGEPPFPERGIFEMSILKGWDDFNNPTFTIEHNEPFNIELIGVFYSVDTY